MSAAGAAAGGTVAPGPADRPDRPKMTRFAMWSVGTAITLVLTFGVWVYSAGRLTERKADRAEVVSLERYEREYAAATKRAEAIDGHLRTLTAGLSDLRGELRALAAGLGDLREDLRVYFRDRRR